MLGRSVPTEEYGRLEFFEVDRPVRVTFRTDELEALCPAVEGIQPDIYSAEISYTAQTHAIESKSLKLWLVSFRDRRIFAEHLVAEIHDQLASHEPAIGSVSVRLTQNAVGWHHHHGGAPATRSLSAYLGPPAQVGGMICRFQQAPPMRSVLITERVRQGTRFAPRNVPVAPGWRDSDGPGRTGAVRPGLSASGGVSEVTSGSNPRLERVPADGQG